jgi:hypothetical protein
MRHVPANSLLKRTAANRYGILKVSAAAAA